MANTSTRIALNELESSLSEIIKEFFDGCEDEVDKVLEDAAEVAKEEVKKEPPGAGKFHDWKSYNSGWVVEKTAKRFSKGSTYVIHNKKKPQLTHLLEDGHVNVDGSRARAFPHVAPAAKKAVEEALRRLTDGL